MGKTILNINAQNLKMVIIRLKNQYGRVCYTFPFVSAGKGTTELQKKSLSEIYLTLIPNSIKFIFKFTADQKPNGILGKMLIIKEIRRRQNLLLAGPANLLTGIFVFFIFMCFT